MNDSRKIDSLASEAMIATDRDLISSPPATLLFDKIINIKFIRKKPDVNGSRYFCIRSDYEPVYGARGTVQFVKCGMKPSLSVSYNQVADTVAVNIKIKVDALFIDRELAGEEIDSSAGNPVVQVVVQMGYFDEFPDLSVIHSSDDINRYFDMANDALDYGKGATCGKQLTAQVLTAYRESNAPESTWVFNCCVGSLETGLRWDHTKEDLTPQYGNNAFPRDMSKMEAMFYQWITRRYIRSSIEHVSTVTDETMEDGSIVKATKIEIKGYNKIMGTADKDDKYTTLSKDNGIDKDGLLKPSVADRIGVKCTLSETLKNTFSNDLPRAGSFFPYADGSKYSQAVGSSEKYGASFQLFDEAQNNIGGQLNAMKNHYQFLRWIQLMDGNIYLYKEGETTTPLVRDPAIKAFQKANTIKLPAVYDITMSGMRVIRCPFRRNIDPMTTVLFQSRYRILDETGYYQPARTHDAFLVILSAVSFATTAEDNLMTLQCVDIATEDAPLVDFQTGIVTPRVGTTAALQDYTTDPEGTKNDMANVWAEVSLKVGTYPYDSASFRWMDFARNLVQNACPDDWPSGMPSIKDALTDLKSWNPTLWTVAREKNADGDYSPECTSGAMYGFTDKVPWLYDGDEVKFWQPYKQTSKYDTWYKQKDIALN